MNSASILIRPDRGKKPYRLKCRFIIGAFPSERALEKAKYIAAEQFVRDMEKQGWRHEPQHGFRMTGPYPATEIVNLPKRSQQERWHLPSRDILAAVQAGYRLPRPDTSYVKTVPHITQTDAWEFELAAVFLHETILTESPDPHEEKEALRRP